MHFLTRLKMATWL